MYPDILHKLHFLSSISRIRVWRIRFWIPWTRDARLIFVSADVTRVRWADLSCCYFCLVWYESCCVSMRCTRKFVVTGLWWMTVSWLNITPKLYTLWRDMCGVWRPFLWRLLKNHYIIMEESWMSRFGYWRFGNRIATEFKPEVLYHCLQNQIYLLRNSRMEKKRKVRM